MIYLDNAATTLHKPQQVIDAVVEAMTHMGNSARGAHESTLQAGRIIYNTREQISSLFHGPGAEHVAFTSNSTEALNMAICGLLNPGDHVITTDLEHNSVLRPLYRLEKEKQVEVSFVKADTKGHVNPEDFEQLIQPNTKAIVCTHASNLTGNLVDIEGVGAIAHRQKLLFIVDASQSAGVFPLDMEKMHMDVVCFTGHKSLYGPQGTGGLCVAKGVAIAPLKVGGSGIRTYHKEHPHDMPTRLEAGTLNGHGLAGLGAGLAFIESTGMDEICVYEQSLATAFRKGIENLPDVKLYGDYSIRNRAPIVAMNIGAYDSAQVSDELAQEYGIAVRAGGHCAPRMHQVLGTVNQGIVRFSFSYFNTMDEVEAAIEALRKMTQE